MTDKERYVKLLIEKKNRAAKLLAEIRACGNELGVEVYSDAIVIALNAQISTLNELIEETR